MKLTICSPAAGGLPAKGRPGSRPPGRDNNVGIIIMQSCDIEYYCRIYYSDEFAHTIRF